MCGQTVIHNFVPVFTSIIIKVFSYHCLSKLYVNSCCQDTRDTSDTSKLSVTLTHFHYVEDIKKFNTRVVPVMNCTQEGEASVDTLTPSKTIKYFNNRKDT